MCCLIQAEAVAMFEVVKLVRNLGAAECSFETDNQTIAEVLMKNLPLMQIDWRAFREVFEVWKWFKEMKGFRCKYVPRSRNTVADDLEKRGNKEKWDVSLFTFPFGHQFL